MAKYTREQNQAFETYLADNKLEATTENAKKFLGSVQTAQTWTMVNWVPTPTPITPTKEELQAKIKSWKSSSTENYQYNKLTWDNQWARNLMLTDQNLVSSWDLKTSVTAEETARMKEAWIQWVSKTVTPDLQGWTVDEFKQNVKEETTPAKNIEKTTVETPEWTTTTTTEKPKEVIPPQNIEEWKKQGSDITSLEQIIENQYWTIATQKDWKITAEINGKTYEWFVDEAGNAIKTEIPTEQIKKTTTDYYNSIIQGIDVPTIEKNTPAYKSAYNRKLDLDKFSSMSSSDLSYAISQWQFLPWTQVYNDLKLQNPTLVTEAERLNSINSVNQDKKDVTDIRTTMTEYLTKLMSDDEKETYKEKISENKDLVELNKTLWEQANNLASIKDKLDYAKEDIEADYWKTWRKSYRNFLLWETTRELTRQYTLALSEYNTTAWQIQTLSNDIKYDMEEERLTRQEELQKMTTAYWLYQDMTADERALELNKKQLQQQFEYTYWDLTSTDPTKQRIAWQRMAEAIQTQFAWMPFRRTTDEMAQDIINDINAGKTTEQISTEITQAIQNSPSYWAWASSKWLTNQATWNYELKEVWWVTYNYNKDTGEFQTITWWGTNDFSSNQDLINKYPKEASFKNNNPTWIKFSISDRTKALLDEAGINYSQWTTSPEWWAYMKFATVDDWLRAYEVLLTKAWTDDVYSRLKQWVWTKEGDSYASTLMSKSWIKKWTKFSELNEEQLNTLMTAQLQKESPNFYNELVSQQWPKEYTDDDLAVLSLAGDMTNIKEMKSTLTENWLTTQDLARFKDWQLPITAKQQEWAKKILSQIDDIAWLDWNDATGFQFTDSPVFSWTDRATVLAKIDSLKANLALPNLWMLKWAMSDNDLKFIQNASSNLDVKMSDKEFEKKLVEYRNLYAKKLWLPEIKSLTDVKETDNTETDLFNEIYNQ